MRQQDCFELGIVAKLHGFNGALQIVIDADQPARYAKLDAVFIEQRGQLVPFIIDKIELSGDRAIVKFQDVNDEEAAKKIKGSKLYLPLTALPELEPSQFYYHEIIGFEVEDAKQGRLGKVTNVYQMPVQDLIAMKFKGVEVLIPVSDAIILNVDRTNKLLRTDLPEGLVEVYLEQE